MERSGLSAGLCLFHVSVLCDKLMPFYGKYPVKFRNRVIQLDSECAMIVSSNV